MGAAENGPPSKEDMEKAENSPQAAAFRAYMKAVQSGDIEAIKKIVPSMGVEELSKDMLEFIKVLTPTKVEFQKVIVKGKSAVLKAIGELY